MKCEICGQGVANGIAVYRNNPKGQKGIWRCIAHVDPEYHPVGGVLVIADAIESANKGENNEPH